MNRNVAKKYGRRKAGTYGRTHGPSRGNTKRTANKAVRKVKGDADFQINKITKE